MSIQNQVKQMRSLEAGISKEQASFTRLLSDLNQLNKELEARVEGLKELEKQAKVVADPQGASPADEKQEAEILLKILSPTVIAAEERIKANKNKLDNILARLKDFGPYQPPVYTPSEEFEVFDSP